MENESDETYLLLSGMKVINTRGTFYFSEPGDWIYSLGYPVVDKLHRENGPAVEYEDGTKFWYLNGRRHRADGPAVEYTFGSAEWWENGKRIK